MQLSSPAARPYWLLLAWFLLNAVQAAGTPLDPDETYYWKYAGALDWGYFDHPPAVALLVSIGRDWLPGALGLRLGHVLAGTATVAALYHLLDRPRGRALTLAAVLIFAQPLLQVYGFIATPDAPLLLFTALYLIAYRAFLDRPGYWRGAVWGLTMTGLMYSKYHGAVVIFFSVLPNLPFLLRQPGAWLAALGGAALFVPHLAWQYAHDFPSFRYHLAGRNASYRPGFTFEYLGTQLVLFSPFLLYYYYLTFTRARTAGAFARGCRWLVVGFLLFFLANTFKGRAEAHWTAAVSVPLVYLTYRAASGRPDWWRPLILLGLVTGAILVVARLLLLAPREWLPFSKPFDHAPWVRELAGRAGERPVIIENSYRLASLYEFYSGGKPAYTLTDDAYRPNQYDLWRGDTAFLGDTVLMAGQANWSLPGTVPFHTQKVDLLLRVIPDYQIGRLTQLTLATPPPTVLHRYDTTTVRITAESPLPVNLRAAWKLRLFAVLVYPDGEREYFALSPLQVQHLPAGHPVLLYEGPVRPPRGIEAGAARLNFALGYAGMPPLRDQSPVYPVRVAEE